ncbi:L,D-transpeptidase [Streptomyces qinzhouensis]|uniref:L,D-transpeptidase n=1 Tax=Streptomyces qinzhouensis TaxID=2599401 RepID=UPI001FE37377|nr:Ig-like domain-containing protein [Streptomyces qinzhouensis]
MSARPVRHPATRLAVAAAVLAPLALAGCSSDGSGSGGDGKAGSAKAADKPATVAVTPSGSGAKAGQPIKVTAQGGKLTSVQVSDADGGTVTGKLSANGTVWTSDRKAGAGASYQVTAATKTESGTTGSAKAAFTTAKAEKKNLVTFWPLKGSTVGIGQPISLVFDFPVADRAEVEKALKVTTSNNTEGSWGWLKHYDGKDRIDWRPKEYWKPGTQVTLDAPLNGIATSKERMFARDYAMKFTIGAKEVVKVDLNKKKLVLERNGSPVRTIPVSGGTPGGEKRSWGGTTVLISKEGTINMNSETVGLGDAYNKMVDYSMRLTWSGMYAHAAPWNSSYFGRANKSSGCIGMSTGEAASFYKSVKVGTPFETTGRDTKGIPAQGNGFSNWNESWEQWKKRSALS